MAFTRSSSLVRRVVAVALATGLAAGCAHAVQGSAQPNRAAADNAAAAAYERGITAFRDHFDKLGDEKANVYNYVTFGDQKRTNEFESAKLGDPAALVFTKRRDATDDALIVLHPSGAATDFVRLDHGHAALAPTPWVSVPADYQPDLNFRPQFLLTAWFAVQLDAAIAQTKLESADNQPHTVQAGPDGGHQVLTGATLGTMIDKGIATVPAAVKSKVTPRMRASMVPVRIDLNANWEFVKLEVRASVPGDPDPLELQVGYEVAGTASEKDIPAEPPPAEVTAITERAAVDKFWTDVNNPTTGG